MKIQVINIPISSNTVFDLVLTTDLLDKGIYAAKGWKENCKIQSESCGKSWETLSGFD